MNSEHRNSFITVKCEENNSLSFPKNLILLNVFPKFFCDAYSSVLTSFEYLLPISYKYIIITLCCIVVL